MNINFNRLTLHTARLDLRLFKPTDLNDFYEYASVEGVGEPCGWRHHESIEESKKILDIFLKEANTLAIVYKESNKVIGSIGIMEPRVSNKDCLGNGKELGYALSKDFQGIGIMTEAIREVLRYLMLDIRLDYVIGTCYKTNKKSKRVFEKNKFNIVGETTLKDVNGNDVDSYVFSILGKDYLNRCEKIQIYDINFNKLNRFIYRGETIKEPVLRGVVDIIIYNEKYNKYLMTRRDINKETFPNMLETTGGAIKFGENEMISAKREVFEETGIKDIDLTYLYEYNMPPSKALYFVYLGKTNIELDEVKLQEAETIEYLWLDFDEYYKKWKSDEVNSNQASRLTRALELIKRK